MSHQGLKEWGLGPKGGVGDGHFLEGSHSYHTPKTLPDGSQTMSDLKKRWETPCALKLM